jgi:hypothetical protein
VLVFVKLLIDHSLWSWLGKRSLIFRALTEPRAKQAVSTGKGNAYYLRKKTELLDPIHPGEILLEDFMKPMGISINRLARDLDVAPNRIGLIVNRARHHC